MLMAIGVVATSDADCSGMVALDPGDPDGAFTASTAADGLGDGLPLLAPTPQRVAALSRGRAVVVVSARHAGGRRGCLADQW
ncbi:hypothetical protein [Conexibacter sp. CPCC 206217]|uniref:hypothetical protein n=1 Tax=Conexibacter sp. CPCC 206217 TaxID=3064574 RepID=UPI002720CEDB|nr:hypothetical protein [Conexibacter sp. CPCC 206217]MDO8208870.1 hypothetical protein [Conexibacter sp. CPCC 206217]